MPLSEDLAEAFNDQLGLEFEAMYVYLQMAAHFDASDLPGFARWMRLQADEERGHAMRLFDFILDRGSDVELRPLSSPKVDTSSPLATFRQALEHEQRVTRAIHDLYAAATAADDYASYPLLQWFIEEQTEEEATLGQIVQRLAMAGEDPSALLLLDQELGGRTAAEA
jgi:ferritin